MSRTVIIVIAGLILLAGASVLLSGSRTPRSPADTSGEQGIAPSSSRIGSSALSHGGPARDVPVRRKTDDEPRAMPNPEGAGR